MCPDGIPASLSSVKWDFCGINSKAIHEQKAFSAVTVADVHYFLPPFAFVWQGAFIYSHTHFYKIRTYVHVNNILSYHFGGRYARFILVFVWGFAEENKQN